MVILKLETEDIQDLMIWLNFTWNKASDAEEVTNIEKKNLTDLISEIRSQILFPSKDLSGPT
jgi:hypothetical protein